MLGSAFEALVSRNGGWEKIEHSGRFGDPNPIPLKRPNFIGSVYGAIYVPGHC